MYLPYAARPAPSAVLIVRDPSGSPAVTLCLREEVRALDADLPLYGLQSLERTSEKSRWRQRAMSTMLTIFGGIATLLSALGIYALTAYGVAQRTHEIGLRMALGARASHVSWLFLRSTAVQVAIGLAFGIAGGVAIGVALRGLLVQSSTTTPFTATVGISVLLAMVALLAGYVPARRATRLDPVLALRRD